MYTEYDHYDSLCHFGIKGMHWGVRRYQNEDGSYTEAGKKHRNIFSGKVNAKMIAGMAVAAGIGAAFATKHIRVNKDTVVKAGTELQRIARNNGETYSLAKEGHIYAAAGKFDKVKYGAYAKQMRDQAQLKALFGGPKPSTPIVNVTLKTTSDIKIAGRKNALKIYKDTFGSNGYKGMSYDEFNRYIPTARTDKDMADAYSKFSAKVKENGYSGIKDMNDMKYSGYNAKTPYIYNELDKISVKNVKELNEEDIDKMGAKGIVAIYGDQLATSLSPYAAGVGLGTAAQEEVKLNTRKN